MLVKLEIRTYCTPYGDSYKLKQVVLTHSRSNTCSNCGPRRHTIQTTSSSKEKRYKETHYLSSSKTWNSVSTHNFHKSSRSEVVRARNMLIQHRYNPWNYFGMVAWASWAISDFSSKTSPKNVVHSNHLKVGKLARDRRTSIFNNFFHSYTRSQFGAFLAIQLPNDVLWTWLGLLASLFEVAKIWFCRKKMANRPKFGMFFRQIWQKWTCDFIAHFSSKSCVRT